MLDGRPATAAEGRAAGCEPGLIVGRFAQSARQSKLGGCAHQQPGLSSHHRRNTHHEAPPTAGEQHPRNLVWDNGSASGGTVPVDGLTVAETIAEAPRFADANYRLEPTSPAVDAAIAVAELGVDHDGRPRPRGEAPELGAHESW